MPKRKRKYPSKKPTTTPEGYREYKKFQMREVRRRKKQLREQAEQELLKLFPSENELKIKIPSTYALIFGKPKRGKKKKVS